MRAGNKSTLATPKQVVNGRQKRGQRIEKRTASQNGHERPRATGRPWCGRGVVGGGQRRGEGEVGDEVAKPRRGREMEGRGAKERRREGRSQRARAQGGTSAFAHWPWVPTPSPPNLIVRYLRVQEGTARRWQCVITLAPVAASAYGAAVGHLLFPTSRPQLALPFCWAPVQKQQTMRLSGCRREQAEDHTRLDFGFNL